MNAVEMREITKHFPGTLALNKVDFSLGLGETKALLGENGAGKSTLIKILSGAVPKDEGSILVRGEPVEIRSPEDSRLNGIGVIYQEFTLVPALSVAENIFLGRVPHTWFRIQRRIMNEEAERLIGRIEAGIDVRKQVSQLSVADRQVVEIAKALSINARVLVMDEPTAALSKTETDNLFRVIRILKEQQVSIIYVSHRLEEIFEVADSVAILRDGRKVADEPIANVTPRFLVSNMIGRELTERSYRHEKEPGDVRLEVIDGFREGVLQDINIKVRAGEIVAVTGLIGAGQSPLSQCLFGMMPLTSGKILIDEKEVKLGSPNRAIESGIGLVPEDRRLQGLVLRLPIRANVTLATLSAISRFMRLNKKAEVAVTRSLMDTLQIKAVGPEQIAGSLSGGNQQKVVIAKWLVNKSKILIFHEPTRGIDVGAREEIYRLMRDLASSGTAILLISSDTQEVLNVSDRLYVIQKGRIIKELETAQASKEDVLLLATATRQ